jgi:sugar lactone lactonase YvrE
VVASLEGKVLEVIGDGGPGLRDGTFDTALFDHPHGLALGNGVLYIADAENHVIRRADLARKEVETIAGTGAQARGFHGGGKADSVALNSPWDLTLHNGTLYIAMAGFHQLWALDLSVGEVRPYAGSGREGISDSLLAGAMLAQPNGITTDGRVLFFADSETSAIRTADLDGSGRVVTLVGTGLFDFGDVDGSGPNARLQHVQGICYHDGFLYLADTYNNKIKRLDPKTRSVMSFLGSAEHGLRDGTGPEARFHEPEGLAVASGKLYITDTNNHAIRVADLQSGRVSTLELRF